MLQLAGRGHHDLLPGIWRPMYSVSTSRGISRMPSSVPAPGGPAHARESAGLEMIEDDVVRRIVGLADFLKDDAAFALHLLRLEAEWVRMSPMMSAASAVSSFST